MAESTDAGADDAGGSCWPNTRKARDWRMAVSSLEAWFAASARTAAARAESSDGGRPLPLQEAPLLLVLLAAALALGEGGGGGA